MTSNIAFKGMLKVWGKSQWDRWFKALKSRGFQRFLQ